MFLLATRTICTDLYVRSFGKETLNLPIEKVNVVQTVSYINYVWLHILVDLDLVIGMTWLR